jgi:penicillin amidase
VCGPYNSKVLLKKVLRVVNVLLGLLCVCLLVAAWWFFWRPLPQTSGTVSAPVQAAVESVRDELGVPHIKASSESDLYFAQGYITAQERLWQMDGLRRFAAGDLSEIVGRGALASDIESRRLRMRHIAEAAYVNLPPADRAQIAAYALGVNRFMDTHRNALSFEFNLLQYSPRAWSVVDSVLIGLYMYRNLTSTMQDELLKANLLNGGDTQKVKALFPLGDGPEVQAGSNAWAVSGAHTASGKPLLSNDMHLEFSLPGIWFMVSLEMPGMHVAGVALPGMPGVVAGHNDHIAWGMTNLGFDVQDLYIERMDPHTGAYLYDGKREQAFLEREWIAVKNDKPLQISQWITRHGPVRIQNGQALALKWAAADPKIFQYPFPEINRARNWQEFLHGIERFPGPGQNFVYADSQGNIGYHATGRLPIRKTYAGDVPVDGSDARNEWAGYIPFDQLPAFFNPPGGMIVTANQNPFPANYPYPVSGYFAPPYRARQIHDLLKAHGKLKPEDTLRIQRDVYSGFNRFLAKQLVQAFDRKHPQDEVMRNAIGVLRNFDGQMDKDHAAPMITSLAYHHFRTALLQSAARGKADEYKSSMSLAVMQDILTRRPAGWFADYDAALLAALHAGLEQGRTEQGRDSARWRYGTFMTTTIAHPIAHAISLLAPYFDIGPVPMSGGTASVKQTTKTLGPSERLNIDLGNWDNSLENIVIGESSHRLSSHYKDQWEAYYNGTSFPMQFNRVNQKGRLVFTPLQ